MSEFKENAQKTWEQGRIFDTELKRKQEDFPTKIKDSLSPLAYSQFRCVSFEFMQNETAIEGMERILNLWNFKYGREFGLVSLLTDTEKSLVYIVMKSYA